jgi:hypothetical protein
MSGPLPRNLCFFSARCRYCQNFLEELAKTPYSKEFRFISVDAQGGQRPTLPPYVKAVPTLMIEGEREPRTDSLVMNWLSERKLKDKSGAAAAAAGDGGLLAFNGEMSVNGDEFYSFLNEEATATKGDMVRMVGTMASFDNLAGLGTSNERMQGDAAAAAGANIGTPRQSDKAKALDDALMAYQQMRDRDMRPSGPSPGAGPGPSFSAGGRR